MKIRFRSVRGPWHIFGFTEDAVQLELDRGVVATTLMVLLISLPLL